MNELKIFTFHTARDGWRLEVYDINNRLVKACKAKDRSEAQSIADGYIAALRASSKAST